jgi:hypothetical protein
MKFITSAPNNDGIASRPLLLLLNSRNNITAAASSQQILYGYARVSQISEKGPPLFLLPVIRLSTRQCHGNQIRWAASTMADFPEKPGAVESELVIRY